MDEKRANPLEIQESSLTKPTTTEELVSMLKEAGTELTIKYITGEISNEEYLAQLEDCKQNSNVSDKGHGSTLDNTNTNLLLPNFDQLLEDDEESEPESETETEEEATPRIRKAKEKSKSIKLESGEETGAELFFSSDDEWTPALENKKTSKLDDSIDFGKQKRKRGGKHSVKEKQKSSDTKTRKHKRRRKKDSELPPILAGLNGRAMLLRAQGKLQESMVLLFDIINKAPKAAAPYQALGSIHEEQGNIKQALKFYMVAANLRKSDTSQWFQLIDMCIEQDDDKMANICFLKAKKYARNTQTKLQVLHKQVAYQEAVGQAHRALQTRESIIRFMAKDNPRPILEKARILVKEFLEFDDTNGAISVLQFMHKDCHNYIDSEDVNQLTELLISQENYANSLEILVKHCAITMTFSNGVVVSGEMRPEVLEQFMSKEIFLLNVELPEIMPIDLRSKFIQSLLLLKILPDTDPIQKQITDITSGDVDEVGDVHYDIAEVMAQCGYCKSAKPILETLLHTNKFNKAAVWLTYGQCLNSMGLTKEAADAYSHVVEMAPGHYEARVILSSLQQQMGLTEIALETLTQGSETGEATNDQLLLLRRCQLLHLQDKTEDFIAASKQLLSFNMPAMCTPDFLKFISGVRTHKHKQKLMQDYARSRVEAKTGRNTFLDEDYLLNDQQTKEKRKFKEEVWDVFLKLCCCLQEKGLTQELLEISMLAMGSPGFHGDKFKEAQFLCLKVSLINKNDLFLLNISRHMTYEDIDKNQVWNLYNYIVTICEILSDHRNIMRNYLRHPTSTALNKLTANASFLSGTYKMALSSYLAVFKKHPNDDLALLMCGLSLVNMHAHFATRKNILTPQVMVFLKAYQSIRGECQEAYYNIGRALYHLNLPFAAINYYEKAIELPPCLGEVGGLFDLRQEIAYNIAHIYRRSGSLSYARYYIEKYCTV